jgi:hypothetical protein
VVEDFGGGFSELGEAGAAALAVAEAVAVPVADNFIAFDFVVVAGKSGPAAFAPELQADGFFVGVLADFF